MHVSTDRPRARTERVPPSAAPARNTAGPETLGETLAGFAVGLDYEALPEAVIAKAKLLLLDTVGTCIASAGTGAGRAIRDQCAAWSGAGDCTLIGHHRGVAAPYAAFGNGTLAHAQDFDDTHTAAVVHPSCVAVPAVLAAGERHDRTGAEVLTALVATAEAMIRLALPAAGAINRRGFQATSSVGAFGAALAAARLAGDGPARAAEAVGIAGSFASGLMECVPAGASSKQFQPGWGGFCGLMAADLARAGFTGPRSVFEGRLGYFAAVLHGLPIDPRDVLDGLGRRWHMLDVRPKLYPCAHNMHAAIECAVALSDGGWLEPEQIESILCEPPQGAVPMVCEPWAAKIAPETGYDARFSLPYAVAVALVTGEAGPYSFTDELAHDPRVRGLMARTRYAVRPGFELRDMPGRVTVTLKDGAVRTREVAAVRGDAANPVATDELTTKFMANTATFGAARSDRIAAMIMDFEALTSLRPLMAELAAH